MGSCVIVKQPCDDTHKHISCARSAHSSFRGVIAIPINGLQAQLDVDTTAVSTATISAVQADALDPFATSNLSVEDIRKQDAAQDVPFLLRLTPSAVVTSDAGHGIGYTALRIRGVDQSRINVTINGVPLNDAESQGVFWVDLPDLGSSMTGLQIQRGVGTSTNGPAAFGATVSVNTLGTLAKPGIRAVLGEDRLDRSGAPWLGTPACLMEVGLLKVAPLASRLTVGWIGRRVT